MMGSSFTHRQKLGSLLLVCTLGRVGSLGLSAHAHAAQGLHLQPSWKNESVSSWDPNLSFLNDFRFQKSERPDWLQDLIDPGAAARIEKKCEAIDQEYEQRAHYGLLEPQAGDEKNARLTELRKEAMEEVRRHQRRKQVGQLRKAIDNDQELRKPVSVAAALAAAATGMPYEAALGDSTQLTVATNIPFQTGYIRLKSAVGDSALTAAGNPNAGNSLTLPPPEWVTRQEHYTLSFSRSLPVWGLGSGVVYGGTSNTVSASLSKQLTSTLNCSVNSVQPLDSDVATKPAEQNVRLNYELHF